MKIFFILLFTVASSWASCYLRESLASIGNLYERCQYGTNCSSSNGPMCSSFSPNCGTPSRSCSNGIGYIVETILQDDEREGCGSTQYRNYLSCDIYCCNDQNEADSSQCVSNGGRWEYDASTGVASCNENTCDTTMQCIEYPFNRCEEVQSDGIDCDENGCSGLPHTRWFSEYRKECRNDCGDIETQSFSSDTLNSLDSDCSDTVQCSEQQFCVDFPNSGTYMIYTKCIVGNETIGNVTENRSFASIVNAGNGSCSNLGMPSDNFKNPMNNPNSNSGFPNTSDNSNLSDNCLIYGIDCPENFVDTTDYNNNNERNPDHCKCERFDGMTNVSSIFCPDGSITTFFGSCRDWENSFSSSSSNPPESSSSGSENPPTSSGGGATSSGDIGSGSSFAVDFSAITKNQTTTNSLLGSMAQTLKQTPSIIVSNIKEFFNQFVYSDGDGNFSVNRRDSVLVLDTILDTAGLLHAIFGRVDSVNRIIDTVPHSSFGGCPCITLFGGNGSTNSTANGHLAFQEMRFDFGNIKGVNLCRVISTIVVAFASVVSFFIGFSIFKNISQ